MRKKAFNHQGFTLVEMIVVIAIIAILAAVIIPTTAGFIDRARLSNDRQTAAQMTRALQAYNIEEISRNNDIDWTTQDAYDVRTILNTFADEPFDMTPSARETGYFFVNTGAEPRVVALKYDEAAGIDLNAALTPSRLSLQTQRVSAAALPNGIHSPEQLFGLDRLLLTQSGSTIALVVTGLRSNVNHTLLADTVNDDSLWTRVRGGVTQKALLEGLLDEFSPTRTLYISNSGYRPQGAVAGDIEQVIFAPGISHLPQLPVDLDGNLLSNAPRTLRTVEPTPGLTLPATITVRETVARDVIVLDGENLLGPVTINGVEYANGLNLSLLPSDLRERIVGYNITLIGDWYEIRIFTREGYTHRAVTPAAEAF